MSMGHMYTSGTQFEPDVHQVSHELDYTIHPKSSRDSEREVFRYAGLSTCVPTDCLAL